MRTASCPSTSQPSSPIQLEACMVLATEGLPIAPCGVIRWEMNTTLGTCHQGGWWRHLWGRGRRGGRPLFSQRQTKQEEDNPHQHHDCDDAP
jgi:hypothetical protein